MHMLTRQRKELLLARLRQDGQIVAKSLSEELGLSEDTIRRDLRELAAEGKLQRVHGGALPASAARRASRSFLRWVVSMRAIVDAAALGSGHGFHHAKPMT